LELVLDLIACACVAPLSGIMVDFYYFVYMDENFDMMFDSSINETRSSFCVLGVNASAAQTT
jgi:hypothetical protein